LRDAGGLGNQKPLRKRSRSVGKMIRPQANELGRSNFSRRGSTGDVQDLAAAMKGHQVYKLAQRISKRESKPGKPKLL